MQARGWLECGQLRNEHRVRLGSTTIANQPAHGDFLRFRHLSVPWADVGEGGKAGQAKAA